MRFLFIFFAICFQSSAQGVVYLQDGSELDVFKASVDGATATVILDLEETERDKIKVKNIRRIDMESGDRFIRTKEGKHNGYWIKIDAPERKLVYVHYTMHASRRPASPYKIDFNTTSYFVHIYVAVTDSDGKIIDEVDISNTKTSKYRSRRKEALEMIYEHFGENASMIQNFPSPENGRDDDLERVFNFFNSGIVIIK